jgi:sigma-54 dependent transcriptional regulator, acetoin dehydrogenase operon transcriptional activator AcoR
VAHFLAATHRDLQKAIYEGTFREDLYYRLNVIVIQVPALRDRAEDIVPLGEILIRKYAPPGAPIPVISMNLKRAMGDHAWPRNVRELENYMRKLVIFQDADAIARDLHARIEDGGREVLQTVQARHRQGGVTPYVQSGRLTANSAVRHAESAVKA